MRSGRIVWEQIVEISSERFVTVALYDALAEKELLGLIPSDLREYFETIRDLNRIRNQALLEHTLEITARLNRIGVEPLLIKGASHLFSGLYQDLATRIMYDIDLLVPEDRAAECREYLIGSGYREDSTVTYPEDHYHGPCLRLEGRTGEVELHRRSPLPTLLSTGEMYQDSQFVELTDVRLRIPLATGSLIIAIAHGYVTHKSKRSWGVPLRDLFDTALWMRKKSGEIDWSRVARRFADAGELDAFRTHATMLERLFGQPVSGVSELPLAAWLHWRLCRLEIRNPGMGATVAHIIAGLGFVFADSADGRRARKALIRPAKYARALKQLSGRYPMGGRSSEEVPNNQSLLSPH